MYLGLDNGLSLDLASIPVGSGLAQTQSECVDYMYTKYCPTYLRDEASIVTGESYYALMPKAILSSGTSTQAKASIYGG